MRPLIILALGLAALAGPAAAAERLLKGPEIEALLANVTAVGRNDHGEWRQYFEDTGYTLYVAGAEPRSPGQWAVRGDKYCSLWPPSDHWSCYAVSGDPDARPKTITWISGGTTFPALIEAGKVLP